MSKNKKIDVWELNQEYIDTLKEIIDIKEQELQTQEKTIAFLHERIKMQEENIHLLEQLNENLNQICEAAGLV